MDKDLVEAGWESQRRHVPVPEGFADRVTAAVEAHAEVAAREAAATAAPPVDTPTAAPPTPAPPVARSDTAAPTGRLARAALVLLAVGACVFRVAQVARLLTP